MVSKIFFSETWVFNVFQLVEYGVSGLWGFFEEYGLSVESNIQDQKYGD